MGALTPFLSLYKPGGGSTGTITPDEVVDIDRLNNNSDLLDTFASTSDTRLDNQEARNQQFTGLAASIGAVTGMKLGDTYQETDAYKKLWKYDGTTWITNEVGMFLIQPTSVAGTGVSLDAVTGEVVFAAATPASGITINGAFSSRFRKHRIDVVVDSAAGGDGTLVAQFSVGGVANGSNNYHWIYNETSPGAGPARNSLSAQPGAVLSRHSVVGASVRIEVLNAAQATTKFVRFESIDAAMYIREGGFVTSNTVNVVSDGIKFIPNASTSITGRIRIYGLA